MTKTIQFCLLITLVCYESVSQNITYSGAEQEAFRVARNEFILATGRYKDLNKVEISVKKLKAILKKYPNTVNKKAIISTLFEAKIWLYINGNNLRQNNISEINGKNDSTISEILMLSNEILDYSPQHFDFADVAEGFLKCNMSYELAVEYSLQSIQLLSDSSNLHMPEYYFILGKIYKKRSHYDLAIGAFISADQIIDKVPEKKYKYINTRLFDKTRNLIELADTYQKVNQIQKSIEIYKSLYEQNIYSDVIRDSFKQCIIDGGKTESEAEDELKRMKIYILQSAKDDIQNNGILNKLAPEFSLINYKNQNITLSNYRGKVVVLNFWAGWCYPCFVEMPLLSELKNKYKNMEFDIIALNAGYEFYGNYDTVIHDYKINYEILNSTPQVNNLYDVPPVPLTLIIDKQGYIRYMHKGFYGTMKDKIEIEVEQLIRIGN